MGDPHNPARIGEKWNPHRWHVLANEIKAVKEYGALSGGWAWHFMSPPHEEEKHLHDHRDIDMHVFPNRFAELVVALKERGYRRMPTRFDDPSGEYIKFEKSIEDACPECYEQALCLVDHRLNRDVIECAGCGYVAFGPVDTVKIIFDLFVHDVPTIEAGGYTVVEPVHMLTFYGVKHSSEQCVAVQGARRIVAAGGEIVGNSELVGDWAL